MEKPFILLLDGMTGSGKTTASKLLAERVSRMATIGLDQVKLFISDFERGDRDNNIAREIILSMTKIYLDHNISVLIDQPIKTGEVEIYENVAKEYQVPLYKVQLFTSPDNAFKRIVERMKTWDNPTPEEQVKKNIGFFKSKKDQSFVQIDTTDNDPGQVVEKIANILN